LYLVSGKVYIHMLEVAPEDLHSPMSFYAIRPLLYHESWRGEISTTPRELVLGDLYCTMRSLLDHGDDVVGDVNHRHLVNRLQIRSPFLSI